MPNDLTLAGVFTDIADAIREKTGDESPITPNAMANEILNIPSGGEITQEAVDEFLETTPGLVYTYYSYGDYAATEEIGVGVWFIDSSGNASAADVPSSEGIYYTYDGSSWSEIYLSEGAMYTYEGGSSFSDVSFGYDELYYSNNGELNQVTAVPGGLVSGYAYQWDAGSTTLRTIVNANGDPFELDPTKTYSLAYTDGWVLTEN